MADILQRTFLIYFLDWKTSYCGKKPIEIYSRGFDWQYFIIGSFLMENGGLFILPTHDWPHKEPDYKHPCLPILPVIIRALRGII